MKKVFETVIMNGDYELINLLKKINTYHIEGNITDEEKEELCYLARKKAKPSNSVDFVSKLAELEKRIMALEQSKNEIEEELDSGTPTIDEFKAGKWYYAGDKMKFEDEIYICTAPEGVVCVWSPKEYPNYWEVINNE